MQIYNNYNIYIYIYIIYTQLPGTTCIIIIVDVVKVKGLSKT